MDERLLVINADDLGYSRHVNDRIFELMDRGRITSATLMANGPAFEEAAEGLRAYPQCSFGVHLNCTEFRPLTDHRGLRVLLDAKGHLSKRPSRVPPTTNLLRAIYGEWSAQIERVRSAGVAISHLDSHQHVHTIPQLFPVLKAIQARYGLRVVRKSLNVYESDRGASRSQRLAKCAWNGALRSLLPTRTTDLFLTLRALREATLDSLNFRTAEVMTHPGAPDDIDTPVLLADWQSRLPWPTRLVSYNEFQRAA